MGALRPGNGFLRSPSASTSSPGAFFAGGHRAGNHRLLAPRVWDHRVKDVCGGTCYYHRATTITRRGGSYTSSAPGTIISAETFLARRDALPNEYSITIWGWATVGRRTVRHDGRSASTDHHNIIGSEDRRLGPPRTCTKPIMHERPTCTKPIRRERPSCTKPMSETRVLGLGSARDGLGSARDRGMTTVWAQRETGVAFARALTAGEGTPDAFAGMDSRRLRQQRSLWRRLRQTRKGQRAR